MQKINTLESPTAHGRHIPYYSLNPVIMPLNTQRQWIL